MTRPTLSNLPFWTLDPAPENALAGAYSGAGSFWKFDAFRTIPGTCGGRSLIGAEDRGARCGICGEENA